MVMNDIDSDSSSEDDYFTRQSVLSDSEAEGDISVGSLDSRPSHAGSNVYNDHDVDDSFDSMDDDLAQSSDRSIRDRSPSPPPAKRGCGRPRGRPRGRGRGRPHRCDFIK
jgi:hypothetical protein